MRYESELCETVMRELEQGQLVDDERIVLAMQDYYDNTSDAASVTIMIQDGIEFIETYEGSCMGQQGSGQPKQNTSHKFRGLLTDESRWDDDMSRNLWNDVLDTYE